MSEYQPLCPILDKHNLDDFDCGVPSLNDWLKRHARHNEERGASRTYVVCDKQDNIIGYYALANGAVILSEAPKNLRRNMPDPIPVMTLGRLATDLKHRNKGIGSGMLRDAVFRSLKAGEIGGIRAILVHSIPEAKNFYERKGFLKCPVDDTMYMLPLKPINKNAR
ncbi:MAG: GNAT family N-acetyltransferase [Candidatus Omnitrophica bacterium]|nr:GNAT family N-acetyltransferase [Candidatus Omnitrophota bacterium]MCK5259502.1 GNAT family N-acetyltransferase [Candidatus Omnitrophota bacterium]